NTAMIVGITVGVLMLLLIVILFIVVIIKKKKEKIGSSNNNATANVKEDEQMELQKVTPRNDHNKKPEGALFKNNSQIKSQEVTPRAEVIEEYKDNEDDVDLSSEALPTHETHEENVNPMRMVSPMRHSNELNIPN
ncbi:unnamed protein product, partial [Owenia fusiformis]